MTYLDQIAELAQLIQNLIVTGIEPCSNDEILGNYRPDNFIPINVTIQSEITELTIVGYFNHVPFSLDDVIPISGIQFRLSRIAEWGLSTVRKAEGFQDKISQYSCLLGQTVDEYDIYDALDYIGMPLPRWELFNKGMQS